MRPKALKANTALTPLEAPAFLAVVVVVEPGDEAEVAVGMGIEEDNVTPCIE